MTVSTCSGSTHLLCSLDEVHQPIHGLGFGDVEFDGRLADVEIDLAGRAAHVAEIRVGHFAGPFTMQPMMAIFTPLNAPCAP